MTWQNWENDALDQTDKHSMETTRSAASVDCYKGVHFSLHREPVHVQEPINPTQCHSNVAAIPRAFKLQLEAPKEIAGANVQG